MHPKFLEILCCPKTGQSFKLESSSIDSKGMVLTGKLSTDEGIEYPIIAGIPRFVSQEYYASSFGYEWKRFPRVQFESENLNQPMAGYTTRMWEIITEAKSEDIRGKMFVEFGCGSGRFLDVVRYKGGIAIGIDLSQAVESARDNFKDDPDVLIVQGDLNHPPFRENVFDGGYTIGVLHHTPEPLTGLKALVKTVKPQGWVACCVYPKGEFYDYISVKRFRQIHNQLQGLFKYYPALSYAYLSAYFLTPILAKMQRVRGLSKVIDYLEKNWIVLLNLPDVRWRILDIFDAITPAIASTHTTDEVLDWMQQANCLEIRKTSWCSTSMIGLKHSSKYL